MHKSTLELFLLLAGLFVLGQDTAKFTRTEDVSCGRKFGTALTLDVFRPEKLNKCAVILW
ncbi:MAG TPA: hypothetical protein VJ063_07210 [Verrucomicrobiae bacterium]|nr:hypothetical protein [Verrucomicrobiae bacterium]